MVTMQLFISLCPRLIADLADGLQTEVTLGSRIAMILAPAVLSGLIALLVQYLVAVGILPARKRVTGKMPGLVMGWYLDRICQNNAYLLVRSVGLAMVVCAALGVAVVTKGNFASSHPQVRGDVVAVAEYAIGRD